LVIGAAGAAVAGEPIVAIFEPDGVIVAFDSAVSHGGDYLTTEGRNPFRRLV